MALREYANVQVEREQGITPFLDEKRFKPGLGPYHRGQ